MGALVGVSLLGGFDTLERQTMDWRARQFDAYSPAASDELVILGIDDRALREEGAWPWDRGRIAGVVRELTSAGAGVIALDVLFEEPREGDVELGEAIASSGRVVAPIRFSGPDGRGETDEEDAGAEITLRAAEAIASRGWMSASQGDAAARDRALERAAEDVGEAAADRAGVRNPRVRSRLGAAAWTLAVQRGRSSEALAERADANDVQRAAGPAKAPVAEVGTAAARVGDVSLSTLDADGVLRRVAPATVWPAERVWENFAIAGVELMEVRRQVTRREGRGVSGPAMRWRVPTTILAWPKGGREYRGQFERAGGGAREVSIVAALEPARIAEAARENLEACRALLEEAVKVGLEAEEGAADLMGELMQASPGSDEYAAKVERVEAGCEGLVREAREFLEFVKESPPDVEMSEEDRARLTVFRAAAEVLPRRLEACRIAGQEIAASRDRLRGLVEGKMVFIGFAATGIAADRVATSVHGQTPGVYVHAAVANMALTGFVRSPAPRGVDVGVMIVMGVLGALVAMRLPIAVSPVVLAALLGGWYVVCGAALWDYGRVIVWCAGPGVASGGAWLSVMLHRALVEQRDRRRTQERFSAYVSPEVVELLVENPRLRSLSPQRREITVMMTDLEGFTALAERLGEERTGRVLGRYLSEMSRILLAHGATIDKFLGDGIMAFWGAPLEMEAGEQARRARASAAAMHERFGELVAAGEFEGGGVVRLRIGIAAGALMVGDFGCPPTRSSYTVIGDAANLASRLEQACKTLGVGTLLSGGVGRWIGEGETGAGMFRVGRLGIRGRARAEEAWAAITGRLDESARVETGALQRGIAAFQEGRLDEAEREFGELIASAFLGTLARVYMGAIGEARARAREGHEPLANGTFEGTISVSEG